MVKIENRALLLKDKQKTISEPFTVTVSVVLKGFADSRISHVNYLGG